MYTLKPDGKIVILYSKDSGFEISIILSALGPLLFIGYQ